ncbi:MAG: SDR family oxidoreductase [Propioniciclava sp.]|uniref:SDR family oxidoreductase n=1 Tax=Propioniciclava sp. TaxID=2038686 RepID=UPI0039E2D78F
MSAKLFDLSGRLALVTGSSRGLGNTLARGLAAAGADLVLHGRDADRVRREAAAIAGDYGVKVSTTLFDVTDRDGAARALDGVLDTVGVPDILVNNAGIQSRAPFNEIEAKNWDAVLATNLSSVFYVSQPITRRMAERGSGKVVNIGSVVTLLARQTVVPYTAAKGGVAMLSKGMAADLARFNVQVNTISPGYFASEMNTALINDPEFDAWVKARTPAQRWGDFEELVGALIFLASDASSFVSGQNIFVDGGMTSVV